MQPLRIALIGFGKIARDQHVPAIQGSPHFELAAIVDPSLSPGERPPGIPCFESLDELIRKNVVAAVAICTPPRIRAELAERALDSYHVLLEKPPCASTEQLQALAKRARSHQRALFAAWHSREAAAVDYARRWLTDKAIERVKITWKEDVRVWHPGQRWLWEEGGYGVFDPGINALSIVTHIVPGSFRVADATLSIPENCGTPIAAQLRLTAEKVSVECDFDFLQTGPQTWDIDIETRSATGSHRLLLSHGGARLRIDGVPVEVPERSEYGALYERFSWLCSDASIDADGGPLKIVTDALATGRRISVAAFADP